ncbi:hypothetical protein BDZ45DRAFT_689680 [Acephala macrosclerotiorum]|nr:hypothetical protein BDZ45DRAFT_689680 [Acephala macrosclerotiorum]
MCRPENWLVLALAHGGWLWLAALLRLKEEGRRLCGFDARCGPLFTGRSSEEKRAPLRGERREEEHICAQNSFGAHEARAPKQESELHGMRRSSRQDDVLSSTNMTVIYG